MPNDNVLEQLAQSTFKALTVAEKSLLSKAAVGQVADCGHSDQPDDPLNDPAKADEWDDGRQIRAELLRWLCIDEAAKRLVDPRGIRIRYCRINEELDLSFVKISFPLVLSRCRLRNCNFNLSEIPRLDLSGSFVESITAETALIKGSVLLRNVVCINHQVKLSGVQIGGNLICDGSRFENPARKDVPDTGIALSAEAANVKGSIYLRQGFVAKGKAVLDLATIGGWLDCDGGTFENPPQKDVPQTEVALSARVIKVTGSVFMRSTNIAKGDFVAKGAVILFRAEIGGALECDGSQFDNPAQEGIRGTGSALITVGSNIAGDVRLRNSFSAKGEVNLYNSRIGGSLDCDGGKFENARNQGIASSGIAIRAASVRIGGSVFFRSGLSEKGNFAAIGTVNLFGAQIEGSLECDGGKFENPACPGLDGSGVALQASGSSVAGDVLLRKSFSAKGQVNLYNSRIGGSLECDGGKFENAPSQGIATSGVAIRAASVRIGGGVFFRSGISGKGDFAAVGTVSLFGAQIEGSLECDGGNFENPARPGVEGSGVAVQASGASVGGEVLLRNSFSAKGQVILYNSRIGGSLNCGGGNFENPPNQGIASSGTALQIQSARIAGGVLLRNNFVAVGLISLSNAQIEGSLECDGGKFENPARLGVEGSGVALQASASSVAGDVLLRKSFSAKGQVNLYNSRIGGSLDCDGGKFENAPIQGLASGGTAIFAGSTRIAGSAFFRSGFGGKGNFAAIGTVNLFGAQIEGSLECDGGKFENPARPGVEGSGLALQAHGLNLGGNLLLRRLYSASGQVNLNNARIGGNLDCDGGEFSNSGGNALTAKAATIARSVFLRSGSKPIETFSSKGVVSFSAAQIEGNLECDGGTFENPGDDFLSLSGMALQADMVTVAGDVRLRRNFTANGLVQFSSASIGGSFICDGGKFSHEGKGILKRQDTCLDAMNIRVSRDVLLGRGFASKASVSLRKARITGRLETYGGTFSSLDLGDASANSIVDGVDEDAWSSQCELNLDGFTYDRISHEQLKDPSEGYLDIVSISAEFSNIPHRLEWLRLQLGFKRQPYLQLAKVLRNAGNDNGYRSIRMAMEDRALEGKSWWRRVGGWLLKSTIGYGYASERAIYWIFGLILIGTIIYWFGATAMVPTQKDAYEYLQVHRDTPANYGRFHAFDYSIDNSFPLIKLGFQDKWAPREIPPNVSVSSDSANRNTVPPKFLHLFHLFQVSAGWILTSLFAVGVTGLIRKD